jgi:glucosamine--fructose-6-phosphate aminotransferase (isomerizing)
LFVSISQSGETADTLAAQREARRVGFSHTLAICNVPESSLTRESDLVFMTRAGPEIGVASTKAFTTQLVGLLLLTLCLKRRRRPDAAEEARMVALLESVPGRVNVALELDAEIALLAEEFSHRHHALYLGRGPLYPVAMEGALKMKEISYIHAEGYPAAEMKHGPIALIDENMPVFVIATQGNSYEKVVSNIQEVKARKGKIIAIVTEGDTHVRAMADHIIEIPAADEVLGPLLATIPLQLLSYFIAVMRGCNVDQPRNLAKSVTVE